MRYIRMLVFCLLVLAVLVHGYGFILVGLPDTGATGDLLGAVSSLFASALCVAAGSGSRSAVPQAMRSSWVTLGVALGLWGLADSIWVGYEIAGLAPPYPGPADFFYFVGIPILGLGLIGLARTAEAPAGRDVRLTLDTLVLSAALALVTYLLVLRTVIDAQGFTGETGLSVLYPVSDVTFAAFVGVLVLRSRGTRDRPDLMLMTVAFITYWIADGYFAIADATGADYTQSPLALGYVAAPLSIGMAATIAGTHLGRPSGVPSTLARGLSAVLPDAGVFAAVVACAASAPESRADWLLVTSVLGLMAFRQALIAIDHQRERNVLADRVLERTASLQWLSDHHEGILASIGEGVIGVDECGNVTFANPAAAAALGATSASLLGTSSCSITCAIDPAPDHACIRNLIDVTGTSVTRPEDTFLRTNGSRFPVEVTAAPRRGPGTTSGLVLVFRDTTESLAISRMKKEFVSAVSHELRTPLTSIRGALEMLHDGETGALAPIAQGMVATALRGSERLTRLVNDIIDVERLESGSFPMHFTDLEVGPVMQTAVSSLQVLANEAGVELVVCGGTHQARCDSDRLMQALVNLVGNAIKFSPAGARVTISAEPEGKFVKFTVADRGRGIPEAHLESVFERFHQVEASDAREKSGTGLGLPITKSIVEQHGGRIWADSSPGRGSSFTFTIPTSEKQDVDLSGDPIGMSLAST